MCSILDRRCRSFCSLLHRWNCWWYGYFCSWAIVIAFFRVCCGQHGRCFSLLRPAWLCRLVFPWSVCAVTLFTASVVSSILIVSVIELLAVSNKSNLLIFSVGMWSIWLWSGVSFWCWHRPTFELFRFGLTCFRVYNAINVRGAWPVVYQSHLRVAFSFLCLVFSLFDLFCSPPVRGSLLVLLYFTALWWLPPLKCRSSGVFRTVGASVVVDICAKAGRLLRFFCCSFRPPLIFSCLFHIVCFYLYSFKTVLCGPCSRILSW